MRVCGKQAAEIIFLKIDSISENQNTDQQSIVDSNIIPGTGKGDAEINLNPGMKNDTEVKLIIATGIVSYFEIFFHFLSHSLLVFLYFVTITLLLMLAKTIFFSRKFKVNKSIALLLIAYCCLSYSH